MIDDTVLNIGDIEAKLEGMLRLLLTHEHHRWGYCPDCGSSSSGSVPIHHKPDCSTARRVNRLCDAVGIEGMFMAEPTLMRDHGEQPEICAGCGKHKEPNNRFDHYVEIDGDMLCWPCSSERVFS